MISVKNVSFAYKNAAGEAEEPILSDLTLELPEGEVTAVMGESGRGKTTLIKLLIGLIRPDSGTVAGLEGKRISAVFQEDRLLPWYSARKNIAAVLTGTKAENAALTAEILDEMELAASADKPIRELSGGMQRRVAIGRALAFGGDLLLLDEPLKGLDEELKGRIAARILKRFPTVLLITHSEEEAELFGASRIYRLGRA